MIHKGRFSAQTDDDFVVFLIGMRVNNPLKVASWLPVARAMPAMQKELLDDPSLGCLEVGNWFGRTTLSVQYWRDFESLDAYAKNPNQLHLPAWRAFNKAIRDNGEVGIWHETFKVSAGNYEAVYGNMPTFGLASAFDHVSVNNQSQTAAQRLDPASTVAPAVDPY